MERKIAITMIIPPVVVHHLDPHTGIPFMPHMGAYAAGSLRSEGVKVQVLDCFGLQPNHREIIDEFMLLGLPIDEVVALIKQETEVVLVYCRTMSEFLAVEHIVKKISCKLPKMKVCLFENIQAVTSYSLLHVADEFLKLDIDALIMGEPERRIGAVIKSLLGQGLLKEIPGIAFKEQDGTIYYTQSAPLEDDLESLQLPAWDLFQLEGYWIAGFAHAPCGKERFLPLLTSRGCSFKCKFCLAPFVNSRWRSRTAKHVVDEMEHFFRTMGVTDYHVSDLNPTVNERRVQEICCEIIERKLPVTWKLAQGTKIETIQNEKTLELMAMSGCRFIAFSPETGSKRLLKTVGKPFDHEHAIRMARKMVSLGINVQACFVAGLPGETADDQKLTLDYAEKLIRIGVNEVSCYIFTPVPGSELSQAIDGFRHFSQCTPSPSWRPDYDKLKWFRFKMYGMLCFLKLTHPRQMIYEIKGFFTSDHETKMTMSVFKQMKLILLYYFPGLFRKLSGPDRC